MSIKIPSAESMRKLATEKEKEFEMSVLEDPEFRQIIQKIEDTAMVGETNIRLRVEDRVHRSKLNIISKYLKSAGYKAEFESDGPLALFNGLIISW